jgi:hypothetical protein
MVGGSRPTRKFVSRIFHLGVGKRMLRWRCDARVCMPLLIEILARQKVAPAFEPQKGEQKDGPRIPVQCYGCLRSSRVGVLRVFST